MIQTIVRCPGKFFDSTPSGILVNKFSNDLGVIDNTMIFGLIDALEGPIVILVAIVNICQINVYFLIPACILSAVAIGFFVYARPVIMGCKQLDLQKKSPIFHTYSETISGLTQVKVYNQRQSKIQAFSTTINNSTKAAIGFDMVSRGFAFYSTLIGILLMLVGMMMGIAQTNSTNAGLYGVTVVYLITISDVLQWILRQIILVESLMVSA
jgi:ATP-binding cassette, subfamily C (CFTR/MRP), member 4